MKKTILITLCILTSLAVLLPVFAYCQPANTYSSKQVILVSENGEVLLEQNSYEKRPIASMTKIMTLLCIYDAVDSGQISLDDKVVASSNAASMGGSQVFLDADSTYVASELVKSIIVCSANDSCVAMAEHICGSVDAFVQRMNDKAEELSLANTHFENCTGLPSISQFSCANDVAVMFLALIRHPQYFQCSKIWMEDFAHPSGRVTGMTNTNKLVRFYDGCDGGKTGYTSEAQHCLAVTAKRGDTRFVAVVVAAPDSKTRFAEASALLNYGFANFENKKYLTNSDAIPSIRIDGGTENVLTPTASGQLALFQRKGENSNCHVEFNLPSKVKAPVKQGDVVGKATLKNADGQILSQVDLVAPCNVAAKSLWDYVEQIFAP